MDKEKVNIDEISNSFRTGLILAGDAFTNVSSALLEDDKSTQREMIDAAKAEATAAAGKFAESLTASATLGSAKVSEGAKAVGTAINQASNKTTLATGTTVFRLLSAKSIDGFFKAGKPVKKGNSVYIIWDEDFPNIISNLELVQNVDFVVLENANASDISHEVELVTRLHNAQNAAKVFTENEVTEWFKGISEFVKTNSMAMAAKKKFNEFMIPFITKFNDIVNIASPDGTLSIDVNACEADVLFDNIPLNRRTKLLNMLRLQILISLKLINVAAEAVAAMQKLVFD
jgi:hypothetical protein